MGNIRKDIYPSITLNDSKIILTLYQQYDMLFHTIGILVCLAAITKYHRPSGSNDKMCFSQFLRLLSPGLTPVPGRLLVLTAPWFLTGSCLLTVSSQGGRASSAPSLLARASSVGLVLHLHDLVPLYHFTG